MERGEDEGVWDEKGGEEMPPVWESGSVSGWGREGEKSKE